MDRLKRLEAVQDVVLEISRISASCSDITDFLQSVHHAISRIMYAANFYVAIYDEMQHSLRFVYDHRLPIERLRLPKAHRG